MNEIYDLSKNIKTEERKFPWYKLIEKDYKSWEQIPLNNTQKAIVTKIISDDKADKLSC